MRQSFSKSRQLAGRIGAPLVRLLCVYLRSQGHEPAALFGAPLDENADIDLPRWHALLDVAATKLGDPAIGLAIASRADWRDFGLVGYLGGSCATVGEALARSTRYSQLIAQQNSTTFAIEDDVVALSWSPERSRTQQLVDAVGIGMIVAMLRRAIGPDFAPTRVDFISPSTEASDAAYRDFFGCPVYFDQASSRLCFSRDYLERPLAQPEPALTALLDEQALARLQEISAPHNPMNELRAQLVELIGDGKTRVRDLAERNCMSARAMQRFLQQQGSSFQTLLDETRLRLAKHYLADTTLDLSAIANLVGYSDQSSFTRAFQQWTNHTPGQWRSAQLGMGPGK